MSPLQAPMSAAERRLLQVCLGLPLLSLLLFFGLPVLVIVWRSLVSDSGGELGLDNYAALLQAPGIWRALVNSLLLGVATTLITVLLACVLAFGLERTCMPAQRFVAAVLALPMLAPSLVLGLGLIFLLGRNGIVAKMLDTRIDIYGFGGLLIADVLYALPQAVLIVRTALRQGDARQYEAAEVLGASPWRQFMDITLPQARYGLLSAGFVVFTITITDFGNAVVIGGNFAVLATEIYNQVSGQMKFGMGAVVGILLLLPAALSVFIERMAARHGGVEAALRPVPQRQPGRDTAFFVGSMLIAGSIVAVVLTVVMASFIQLWPYRLGLTLKHYDISLADGYTPLWTSLWVSALAAGVGTLLLLMLCVGIRRLPGRAERLATGLSALSVGVPGLVLGLAYVLTFNSASLPWGALYGSAILLALCNYYHYHTQGFMTMMTGMRQVPTALEDATAVLGGSLWRVLRDVYLPALMPTLLAVLVFLFMRSMVTLSAVIFLVTPALPMGAVTVMRLDEAGFTSQAAAFSTCIMAVVGMLAVLLHLLTHRHDQALRPA